MKKLMAFLLMLTLLGGAFARGDETVVCVLTPQGLFDTVPLYEEVGGSLLGEYRAYAMAERLSLDGDWAQVSIGGLTGFMEAAWVTPVPNPNSMPDSFFHLSVKADMTLNGSFMPAASRLGWLGTTALGLYHVSWWDGDRGWQSGFAAPDQVQPAKLQGYGGLRCQTPLKTQPHKDAPALMTLEAGVRMHCEIDSDWCRVTTETGHEGYVPTDSLVFSLALTRQERDCPIVTLKEEAMLLADDRATPLVSQAGGSSAVLLAREGDWALIASWCGQFTGWVKNDQVTPTGQMRTRTLSNGLPPFALAVTAPQENSLMDPGLGLFVQGETDTEYQTHRGFVAKEDVLLIPILGESSRLCTLTLNEGETADWNGETFTGPGAYDIALFPGEEAPRGAQGWALGDERLSLESLYESGNGRLMGLHAWAESHDFNLTLRITALPGGGLYTVRDLGGRDLADRSLTDGEETFESLPPDAYLTFTNCLVELLPGNG